MATVTTTITPTTTPFAYSGFNEPWAEGTALARGELRFNNSGTNIAATGAGDNQQVTITLNLSSLFAWVLCDFSVLLTSNASETVNFADQAQLFLTDASDSSLRTVFANMELISQGTNFHSGVGQKLYMPRRTYSGVVISPLGGAPQLQARFFNTQAQDAAYTGSVDGRFLQYDLSQANHVAVNSAVPVR